MPEGTNSKVLLQDKKIGTIHITEATSLLSNWDAVPAMVRDKAMVTGKLIHQEINNYILNKNIDFKEESTPPWALNHIKNCLESFLCFTDNEPSFMKGKVYSEKSLTNDEHRLQGTIDFYNRESIVDWKSTSGSYTLIREYALQLAGYSILLNEKEGEERDRFIVFLNKNKSEYSIAKIERHLFKETKEAFIHLTKLYFNLKELGYLKNSETRE